MALTVSSLQSRFSGNGLRSAIAFEAEKGYRNALGRKMRFSNFLFSTVSRLCSRSKHSLAKNILEEVDSYGIASISDRSKLLNKVSVLVIYDSLDDLVENGGAEKQSGMHVGDVTDEFDVSLVCARFPSIMLGSSPRVELYDGTTSFSERMLFPTQSCEEFPSDTMCEEQSATVVTEENSHQTLPVEESSNKVLLKSQNDTGSVQFSLDSSISFIPGISKKRCQQLEDSGFHTLRQLLHHFPRLCGFTECSDEN